MNTETLNTALWIVQGILAVIFLMAGIMKVVRTKEQLAAQMDWVADFSARDIRSIGILEIVGAVGLVLPGLLDILPWLTKYVAIGLGLLMIGAFVTHLRRQEWVMAAVTAVLALLCVFVWYGRALIVPL
jgi:uncharacterized membrane protein YphA (DoxX/SURF4 family)